MQIAQSPGRPVLAALRPPSPAARPGGSFRLRSLFPRACGFPLLWGAAVLIPLLAVIGAGMLSWHDVRRDAEARVERTVGMLLQHALRAFATQDAILAAAARAIDGRGWEELRGSAELHRLLADLAAAGEPVVRGVLLADDAGRLVASSRAFPAPATEFLDRDELRAVREGARLAVIDAAGDLTGRPGFALLRPVAARPGPAGRPGVLVTSFSAESLAQFYASATEAKHDVVALLRLDGAVLARHPPMPGDAEAELRPRRAAQLLEALAQPPGLPTSARRSGPDQVERLFIARRVGDWPVAVTYGLSLDGLRGAWRERMLAPAIGGIAAAALLLALTAMAAQGAREQAAAAERRTEAEAQLARAGRAAAIGLLAAGLAHDVKNLVQAVRSGARLMARHAEDPDEVRRCAALLADAAERGRRLVEAMLAFARGGGGADIAMPAPPLDVGAVLGDLVELLNRTLGSGWRVQAAVQPGLPPAQGDRAAFEAAVVNLAANARDAMPMGGTVTIAAWPETLDEPAEQDGLKPGRYVVAAVSDTGAGMDAETLARVGEPFFTTKGPGRGTGLGLATVRGFCARTGGALRLDSEPGRGTTAAMWLPVV